MTTFEELFRRATGRDPYGYQARLAHDGLPPVLGAPTGAGKTGIILAWLWRRFYGPSPDTTPRRLVYALPQRTLVEQVAGEVTRWLAELGLTDTVALHVVMGGEGTTQWQWRRGMHRPAIVVGTVDSLVSKALNRGYGISRATYPIDFALVTNGAHWVIDEIQLAPESTTTLRQLAGFVRRYGTAEPFGLTCMSATVPETLLRTVDSPELTPEDVVGIEPADRTGELATRLAATRTVRRVPADPGAYEAVARHVRERHRPGTLTLVVLNQVDAARAVHKALRTADVPHTLVHSRFRGVDRQVLVERVTADPGPAGHIVVSTQVVEAGVDLDAAVMVTEAAPWLSVVQRAGRCNRAGRVDDAELWWLPPAKPAPYEAEDVAASGEALATLEERAVTGEELLACDVAVTEPEVSVIRRGDLLALFDTAPDLSGADLDVAPYVRDAEDLDVALAWATWTAAHDDGRPPDRAKAPPAAWRCRVPLGKLRDLLKRATVWRFDQGLGRWTRVTPAAPARPGEVLVTAASEGGYDPEHGFDPSVRRPVADAPSLDEDTAGGHGAGPLTGAEDAYEQDDASVAQPGWLPLQRHSDDVCRHARALLEVVRPDLPGGTDEAVTRAGYAHDAGKAHRLWQEALCRLATPDERERVAADGPWAKSPRSGALRYPDGVRYFRHELVSMLLLDGPLADLLEGVTDPDLVRYLVLAHHGKLRVQVREPDEADEKALLGLRDGDPLPSNVLDRSGEATVDLERFRLGGSQSWTRTALSLRDRYGPFVLAYLEALVRVADWRASGGLPDAGPEEEAA